MRHQRSTGRFLRLNRLTSIAEDFEVFAVVGLDFGSEVKRRSFTPSVPVGGNFVANDTSESLWPCVLSVDPDVGRVEGDDGEFEEGEAEERDVRPVVSAFEAEAFAS